MLETFSFWALRERPAAFRWTFAAAAIVVSFLLRYLLDGSLPPGFPYLTFFPAVILTAFFAGTREAIVVAAIGGLLAWYFFIAPARSFALNGTSAVALGFYVFIVATEIFLVWIAAVALRRLKAEQARSETLAKSRSLMFQELQHRVSNHLQVVASLLKFQRRKVTDAAAQRALDEASARLALVARIQRQLHDPDSQMLDIARFLKEMARDMIETAGVGDRVTLDVRADAVALGSDQAVPFGLIATELLSNAVEHGTGADGRGRIDVTLDRAGSDIVLSVTDGGTGLPPGFDIASVPSLGLTIARQFAEQLGGTLRYSSAGGTRAELSFPLPGPAG